MPANWITAEEARVARSQEPLARFVNAQRDLKAAKKELTDARILLKVAVEVGEDLLEKEHDD